MEKAEAPLELVARRAAPTAKVFPHPLTLTLMPRSYTIVEKSQNNALGRGAGWWFILQGKFDTMAPLSFVEQPGTITLKDGNVQPITVADAQLRNGVLSVKLEGVDGHQVGRPATLTLGQVA